MGRSGWGVVEGGRRPIGGVWSTTLGRRSPPPSHQRPPPTLANTARNKHTPARPNSIPTIAVSLRRRLPNSPAAPSIAPNSPRNPLLAPHTYSTVPAIGSQPCSNPTNVHNPIPNTSETDMIPRIRLAVPNVFGPGGNDLDGGDCSGVAIRVPPFSPQGLTARLGHPAQSRGEAVEVLNATTSLNLAYDSVLRLLCQAKPKSVGSSPLEASLSDQSAAANRRTPPAGVLLCRRDAEGLESKIAQDRAERT